MVCDAVVCHPSHYVVLECLYCVAELVYLALRTKAKIYDTYILPVVLYGLECVNWTAKLCNTTETFQNHIMRWMTNHRLTDHIEIKELRRLTSLKPIMAIIKSRTLKLFGHIKRSQIGLTKLCLEGLVEGKRSRGRQLKRSRDNIYEGSKLDLPTLNKITQNRNLWRRMTHVGAHSATGGDSETWWALLMNLNNDNPLWMQMVHLHS